MARLARLAVAGLPQPVLQRGHNGQAVFVDADDRQAYLDLLREAAAAHGVAVHGYALLDNEVQWLATPESADSLSRCLQALGRRYGARFNRRHGRSGTLWDGRFRTAPIEPEPWLLRCLATIETAPVQAGLASRPEDFRWSSAAHHLGIRRDPLVHEHACFWQIGNTPFEREAAWRTRLEQALTGQQAPILREAIVKGWALGSAEFLAAIGQKTGRRLQPRPRGRPPKQMV